VLRLAADENFDARIVAGLLRRIPHLDIVRVQEAGLSAAADPVVLEWAASEGRVLVTHDVRTMPRFATERLRAGMTMPGLVVVPERLPIGAAIAELELFVQVAASGDVDRQILFLPL
jgi:Domain of unknown function (DUF5615)